MAATTTPRLLDAARPPLGTVVLPLALVAAGGLALSIDLAAWRFFATQPNSLLQQVVEVGETFGHAMGVLFILVTLAVLDPARRPTVARLAACSWGAGLVANVVKMMIARTRPHAVQGALASSLETFDRWLPLWTSAHAERSFPSAHTATAFGLAIGLAACYPRGRVMFLVFAALCGLQRVQSGAHFVSDVCCGAAVGCAWGAYCLAGPGLSGVFANFEERHATVPETGEVS